MATPRTEALETRFKLGVYDRAIANPYLDQIAITRDFLLEPLVKGEATKYIRQDAEKSLAGLIPGIGEFADATNVVLYSRKGEYLHAALSAISIIPTIGDAIGKGGKLAVFASKVAPKGGKVEKLGKETVDMIIKVKDLIKNNKALIDKMFDALEKNAEIAKFLPKIKEAINIFLTEDNKLNEKKRKLDKPSSEESLRDWFGRKGEKGSKGGWIDCNTCKKNKETGRKECKACGRSEGEKRSKYPKCRPTPSQCDGFKNKKEK
jgi:hypothetical protein